MSFSWESMRVSLENIFSKACSIPFIWEDELKRIVKAPVGILSLGQSITVGRDSYRYTFRDSDISLDLYGHRELTVSVELHTRRKKGGPSARQLAEAARLALANPLVRDELLSLGMAFVETHPLVSIDFDIRTKRELRASFDVVFRIMLQKVQLNNIDYFESIALSENYL